MSAQSEAVASLAPRTGRTSAVPGGGDIVREQLERAFANAGQGLVGSALVAVALAAAVRPYVPAELLESWLGVFGLVFLTRAGVLLARRRNPSRLPPQRWRVILVAQSLLAGGVWGLAGALFVTQVPPEILVATTFVLTGLCAANLVGLGPVYPAYATYVLACFVPLVAWFLADATELGVRMALFGSVYGGAMLVVGRLYGLELERTLRLAARKAALAGELAAANESARAANEKLQQEARERIAAEEALRTSEEHFRCLVEGASEGIVIVREKTVVFANEAAARILGHESPDAVLGLELLGRLLPLPPPERDVRRLSGTPPHSGHRIETQVLRPDGESLWVEYGLQVVRWYGTPALQVVLTDISERKRVEEAHRLTEARFRDFAETAADWFFEMDAELRYTYISARHQHLTGWSASEIIGRTPRDLHRGSVEDPEKLARHFADLEARRPFSADLLSLARDGSFRMMHFSGKPVFDETGEFLGYRGSGRDVTEAHRLSQQLSYQASHDPLTGLLNRQAFEQRLERVIRSARENGSTHALCYLDLDQFKVINDTCGHMAGDELLRQLGRELSRHIRKRDTIARLGGDEFGVLMEHCSIEQAERIAQSLCRVVEEFRFLWEERSFRVGVSIGVVPIDDTCEGLGAAMSAADTACYAAKDAGRRQVHVFRANSEDLARRKGEMHWAVRIQRALDDERFSLVYQLITQVAASEYQLELGLEDGSEAAARGLGPGMREGLHFELLLRMEDEDGGLILPGAFLPAAERYGLASRIDRWVCDRALDWLACHHEVRSRLSLCAINLSGQSLGDAEFLAHLAARVGEGSVPPERLCFEITETAAIRNLAAATRFIHTLTELGCRFALDDFGSGLSSFAYLKTLPVEYLKIDGQFVKDIVDDPIDYAMVKSINEIGQVMGKRTVAEFVETGRVLARLHEIGVDYAQGYETGRPEPLESLPALVAALVERARER